MELNEAITKVLLVQFKKYMDKEAIDTVEGAGYRIVKREGGYEVTNDTTGRWVFITKGGYYQRLEIHKFGRTIITNMDNLLKFDFVGCLNKEINTAWRDLQWSRSYSTWHTPTTDKMSKLKWAKDSIRYRESDIKDTQEKIRKLQETLFRQMKSKVEAEQKLATVRKELGLK